MAAPKQKAASNYKKVDGQEIRPAYYYSQDEGKFMAGQLPNGELVKRNGKVVPYRSIQG